MKLRAYEPKDLPQLVRLFHDTIHTVNLGDYTQQQVNAWAPEQIDLDRWSQKLAAEEVVVAEWNNMIVGFCAWDNAGYLDFLFVHHAFQRKGIASALYVAAEEALRSKKIQRVYTHASITAQVFFLRQNFRIVREQMVQVRGVDLANAVMEKLLE